MQRNGCDVPKSGVDGRGTLHTVPKIGHHRPVCFAGWAFGIPSVQTLHFRGSGRDQHIQIGALSSGCSGGNIREN
jgi:hypothetical protein